MVDPGIKYNIKYVEKIIPDAYHGTSLDCAEKIFAEKEFLLSRDVNCYLGDGVYFYESSLKNAIEWAKTNKKYDMIGVVKCQINLGRCLDLHNREHIDFIQKVSILLRKKSSKQFTDAFVLNFIATMSDKKIDTIRATLLPKRVIREKKTIYPESRLYEEQQLMICVRNVENILSYSLCYQTIVSRR